MKDLIIEQIERRARLDHDGDFSKAAAEYFRDHPEYYPEYTDEVAGVNKRVGEDRAAINTEVQYRLESRQANRPCGGADESLRRGSGLV